MVATVIRIRKNNEESLFDGTSAQDRAGVDIEASIQRFEDVLIERIEQAYPDADVAVDDHAFSTYYAEGFGDAQDDIDTGYAVQCMAEELFNDGSAWMVDQPSRSVYLLLGETAHGTRYWRVGDPGVSMDKADQLAVFGPATLGSGGYPTEQEAATALADFDLDDPTTWPVEVAR